MRLYSHNILKKAWLFTIILPLLLVNCTPKKYATQTEKRLENMLIDSTISADRKMDLMLADYKIGLDTMMYQIVGYTQQPLTKAQPECTLGNMMADAMLYSIQQKDKEVQIAITNQGGIRIPYVAPGAVTLGKVFEIMPFDNALVVVYIPSDLLITFCDHIAKRGGWPVSGISYEIENEGAKNILVNGKELQENYVYKVATSDYIANGGDDCEFLQGLKRDTYNVLLRDAITTYFQQKTSTNDSLKVEVQNRIYYAK